MFTSRLIRFDNTAVLESQNVHNFRLFKNQYESNRNCGIRCTWPNRPYCKNFML